MNLALFLRELLVEHDCVVIPGFGGLVANYRHARLNKVSHVIYPPAKQIAFNRNLSQNDGLLYKHVSEQLSCSYPEARTVVDRVVSQMLNRLNSGEQLPVEGIGVFFLDSRKLIQFIPSEQENFLLASFGLQAVQLVPVAAEIPKAETVKEETPAEEGTVAHSRTWMWKVAAGIAIPVLLASGWMAGEQLFGKGDHQQFSFRFWDWNQKASVYAPRTEPSTAELLPEIVVENAAPEITDAAPVAEASVPAPTPSPSPNSAGSVNLIAGAFQVEANADNLVAQLKAKGIDASRAGMRGPLHLVSVGAFTDKEKARAFQTELRDAHGLKCWIYAR